MSIDDARLAALERQVAALTAEVASLRDARGPAAAAPPAQDMPPADARGPHLNRELADRLRGAPRDDAPRSDPPPAEPPRAASFGERMHSGGAISGDELESMVGRYVTLAVAALVILMAVGAIIKAAVEKGLLTPEVRVIAGAVAALALAVAGVVFRRRGDVRYGTVLLAISLAMVDLVAWGAGPRLHLVPTSVALGVVDIVAIALAALALYDGSEFLFAIAVAGALSAPFVTSDGGGTALALLLYGGTVLAGALRTARDPSWMRAFGVLVVGALVYALGAAALPMSAAWYGPLLVSLFCAGCAAGALLFGETEWKSELPRAYLAIGLVGVLAGWDALQPRPALPTIASGAAIAAITYAALAMRGMREGYWTSSAVLLPFLSLGIAHAGARGTTAEAAVFRCGRLSRLRRGIWRCGRTMRRAPARTCWRRGSWVRWVSRRCSGTTRCPLWRRWRGGAWYWRFLGAMRVLACRWQASCWRAAAPRSQPLISLPAAMRIPIRHC